MLGHLGAISLKLPNFLTTSQDVTKGADQAKYISAICINLLSAFLKLTKKWNICNCPLLLQKEWEFQKRQTNSIQTCFWTMQLHIISLEETLLTSCVDAFNYFIFKKRYVSQAAK